MARRANQAFSTWIGGIKRQFSKDAIVPDVIAGKVLELTYDDGADPVPQAAVKKTAARKSD